MLAAEPIEMDTSNLTQPLLTDGDEEFIGDISAKASRSPSPIRQSVISDSKSDAPNVDETQADSESRPQQLRSGFLNPDPSDSQLQYTRESKLDERPQLEYEPSDIDDDDPPPVSTVKILKPQHKDVLLTASEPVCIICENCGTTCQTTVIHVFGLSTCLWICLLLVLCFPIAWLPLFWKDVSKTGSSIYVIFVFDLYTNLVCFTPAFKVP